MLSSSNTTSARWSSRLGFILAATGSAVGLGNIWRFSYLVGENGGAAFLFLYLLFVFLLCVPIMLAEVGIGRLGRADPFTSIQNIIKDDKRTGAKGWYVLGAIGLLTSFIIMFYYSVIGGWTLNYLVSFIVSDLPTTREASEDIFNGLLASVPAQAVGHTFFLGLSAIIVAFGLNKGLELAAKILMPIFFLILLSLVFFAMFFGDPIAALTFLFSIDFSAISFSVVLAALGQAFFSLSLGIGILLTFGSYNDSSSSLSKDLLTVAALDSLVAIIAGLAIFPIVFGIGLEPESGPGLVFLSLPVAFSQIPFGTIVLVIFFFLLFIAAITSAISLIEPGVSFLERQAKLTRPFAAAVVAVVMWVFGWLVVLDISWLDRFDKMVTFLLPTAGLGMSLFMGWWLTKDMRKEAIAMNESSLGYLYTKNILRFIAPVVIMMVLITPLVS